MFVKSNSNPDGGMALSLCVCVCVNVVCWLIEVSEAVRYLVQRDPTEYVCLCVCVCVIEFDEVQHLPFTRTMSGLKSPDYVRKKERKREREKENLWQFCVKIR
jgi:hypothetical protein